MGYPLSSHSSATTRGAAVVVRQDEKEPRARLFWITNRPGRGVEVAVYSLRGVREALHSGNSCVFATGRRGCTWIYFRDYEQRCLTSPHCSHIAGSTSREQEGWHPVQEWLQSRYWIVGYGEAGCLVAREDALMSAAPVVTSPVARSSRAAGKR